MYYSNKRLVNSSLIYGCCGTIKLIVNLASIAAFVFFLPLALATPSQAASDTDLPRKAGQAPGAGVMRDASGNRVGTLEQQGADTQVIRDASGNRIGTRERSGAGWIERDAQGRRVGTVDGR
jgi:YD repeat-containing protein